MKSNIKIFFTSLLLVSSYTCFAQVLSLDSVFEAIKVNNHMIHEYDWKIEAMNAYAEGAKSWEAPMVGGGTFMKAYPYQKIMEERDKGMLMFSFQQEIPNPAKLRAKKEYLASKSSIEEAGRDYTFNELKSEAKKVYFQWIVLEKKMAILKENEAIMQTMKKLADIRYPYAQGSLGNVYKAEGRLYDVQNKILMTEVEIEQKNILLNTFMNIDKQTKFRIDTNAVKTDHLALLDTASLLSHRSDVRLVNRSIESMKLNSRMMSFEAKPNLNFRFDHMSPFGGGPQMFTAMAMVSIPIAPWSSKMYKSQVKGMGYEIRAMEMEREGILSEAEGMVKSLTVELRKTEQQLKNYQTKIIPALKKNYSTEMLAYEENQGQLPSVINAWETLNMSQMEYLDKLEEFYLLIVNYEKQFEL